MLVFLFRILHLVLSLFFLGLKHPKQFKIGTLSLVYLIAYSCGRIWIEGLRTDSLMLGPLRVAQVISLAMIALGIWGLFWLYRLNRPLPDVISHKN